MNTTAQELSANIGKTATLNVAGTPLSFSVVILDARKRYGNLDYKVKPVAGEGEAWHQSTAIVLDNNEQV
jgi:glycerol-3-phosphate acyltransferase PlsY